MGLFSAVRATVNCAEVIVTKGASTIANSLTLVSMGLEHSVMEAKAENFMQHKKLQALQADFERTREWEQWLGDNADKLEHPVDYERKFVHEILMKIDMVRPKDVVPQLEFVDSGGRRRRIDFVILDETRGLGLAIELDGLSKLQAEGGRGADYAKYDDFLVRQNALLAQNRGKIHMLFRFTNKRWLNEPGKVVKEIVEELTVQCNAHQEAIEKESEAQATKDELVRVTQVCNSLRQQLVEAQKSQDAIGLGDNVDEAKAQLEKRQDKIYKAYPEERGCIVNSRPNNGCNSSLVGQSERSRFESGGLDVPPKRDKDIEANRNAGGTTTGTLLWAMGVALLACAVLIGWLLRDSLDTHGNTPSAVQTLTVTQPTSTQADVPMARHEQAPTQPQTQPPMKGTPDDALSPKEARYHVGTYAKVCGTLVEIKFSGSMTFLNFNSPFPANEFAAAITDENAPAFAGVNRFVGRDICVRGEIVRFGKKAGVRLKERAQLLEFPQ